MKMSQEELTQTVFMFSDKNMDLFDSKNEFRDIQEALKNCTHYKDADIEVIPTFKFF